MTDVPTWFPASGCCPCAIRVDALGGEGAGGLNPIPWFVDLNRGYYSIPLSSMYSPVPVGNSLDDHVLIRTIQKDQVPLLMATHHHEQFGHIVVESGSKLVLRINTGRAWQAIAHLLSINHDDYAAWQQLSEENQAVRYSSEILSFPEELFATFFGFTLVPDDATHPDFVSLARVERDFVRAYSRDGQFGPVFSNLYRDLGRINYRYGPLPLKLLAAFVQDTVMLDMHATRDHDHVGAIAKATSVIRLRQCIEAIMSLPCHGGDLREMTLDSWRELLAQRLPGFALWLIGSSSWGKEIELAVSELRPAFRQLFGEHANPLGCAFATRGKCWTVFFAEPGMIEEDLFKILYVPGYSTGTYDADVAHRIMNIWSTAANNREIVVRFMPDTADGNVSGMVILPQLLSSAGDIGPTCYMFGTESQARVDLALVAFLEGIRGQFYVRRGVRCPLRRAGACCGLRSYLRAVWEAGERLRQRGVELVQWDWPTDCLDTP